MNKIVRRLMEIAVNLLYRVMKIDLFNSINDKGWRKVSAWRKI